AAADEPGPVPAADARGAAGVASPRPGTDAPGPKGRPALRGVGMDAVLHALLGNALLAAALAVPALAAGRLRSRPALVHSLWLLVLLKLLTPPLLTVPLPWPAPPAPVPEKTAIETEIDALCPADPGAGGALTPGPPAPAAPDPGPEEAVEA